MAAAVPGLIMLGVGLIGMWLLGPKSPTSKADSMPQLNNALRGKPISVTFGSNRVYGEIGWTKNFKAVRQKSSGKGGAKGGGSGGFGAAKGGGAAGQSYEYFWDMIFNFGFMDQPAIIRRGWIGGDPIDDTSLNNITAAQTGFIQAITSALFQPADPQDKSAHLKFTEAFYAPGYITGDPNLESWAYFTTQEGVTCQWPGTAWVGFNALDLGQSPSIPQLSYEFVPLTGDFSLDQVYASKAQPSDAGASVATSPWTNFGYVKGLNGAHYYTMSTNVSQIAVVRAEDSAVITHSQAQFQSDLTSAGFVGTNFSLNGGNSVVVAAPNSPYIWAYSFHATAHVTYEIAGICYMIDATGALVVAGHMGAETLDTKWLHGQNSVMSVLNHGDVLHILVQNSNNQIGIVSLGLGGDSTLVGVGTFEPHFAELRTEWGTRFGDFRSQNRSGHTNMTLVPFEDDGYHIMCYIGAAESDYTLAHTGVNTVWDTFITGPCILFGDGAIHDLTSSFGITDIKTHLDGSASASYYDDYVSPNAAFIGGFPFVFFTRSYTTDFGTQGTLARMRSFKYTGAAWVSQQDTSGAVFAVSAAGVVQGAYPESVQACLDTTDGILRYVWYGHNSPLSGYFVTGQYGTLSGGVDVTPPYIIKRILLSPIFGFQTEQLFGYTVTADRIDPVTYAAAVQYCEDQGIKISVTYTDQSNLLDILNDLVSLYGGFLRDPTGIIEFGIVTGVDTPLRTLDNSHFLVDPGKPPVQVVKAALEDGYNKVQLNYLDRNISYNQNQVEAADEVDMDFNGPRIKTYPAQYVMTGSVAQNICARALWANLYGKDAYTFKLGWKDADLSQGDLVTLVDSFDKLLRGGIRARITNWKNPTRGKYEVTAVREFPAQIGHTQGYTQTTSIGGGFNTLVKSVTADYAQTCYELPREFQDSTAHVYFGYDPSFYNMGAQLYLSHDGTNYVLTQDTQPHIVAGNWGQGLPYRKQGYVESDIDFFIFATSPFDITTPTYTQTYDLDNVTQALRAAGAGVFVVGSEAVAVQDLTLLAQNHYRAKYVFRGWGGTPISNHSSGEWFHQHGAGIFIHDISENDIGTKISYKIAPYNFAGQVQDISSIDASSYTIKGYYWLPRVQPKTRIYVDSAQAWPASVPITGPYIGVFSGDGVTGAGTSITLGWPQAANIEGYGAGGFGAGGYGHFTSDVLSTSYRVDVYSSNAVKVSSYLVGTGYFRYTQAMNSADFGGFARNLILKVTPYNVKGDGPVADVRSLSMNW